MAEELEQQLLGELLSDEEVVSRKKKKNISSFPVDYEDIEATYILVIPLPNDKILDWSKLKIFADDNLEVVKNDDLCL